MSAIVKTVPVAFQNVVWPTANGSLFPIDKLGEDRARAALDWVERNLSDFYSGHADMLSEEEKLSAEANLTLWWESTPLYESLKREARRSNPDQFDDAISSEYTAQIDRAVTSDLYSQLDSAWTDEGASVETANTIHYSNEQDGSPSSGYSAPSPPNSDYEIPIKDLPRWPAAVAGFSALAVALSAAAISLFAQAEVASETQATYGWLAWLFPVVIDGGIIAASASIWAWQMEGRRVRRPRLAYGMAAALLIISAVVNVAHAGNDLLGKIMAALPPFVLLGSVELAAGLKQRRLFAITLDGRRSTT